MDTDRDNPHEEYRRALKVAALAKKAEQWGVDWRTLEGYTPDQWANLAAAADVNTPSETTQARVVGRLKPPADVQAQVAAHHNERETYGRDGRNR